MTDGDHGLFGPGSVTWRVMGEPVMWVGGLRAMYLQALHPRTMRATWQNTAFAQRGQAWGRFVRTVEFVRVRTYGSTADAERAGRRVRRIHASLTGTDADGSVIRLDEPELLAWVHCGEVASYADVARRCGMGLSGADLDAFVAEQRAGAALVGLDPGQVPGSMAELGEYYDAMRPRVYACAEARRALLRSYVPDMPWPYAGLRLAVPPANLLAFSCLPRWARRRYGAPGSPLTDAGATMALRALHQAVTRLPRQLVGMPVPPAAAPGPAGTRGPAKVPGPSTANEPATA